MVPNLQCAKACRPFKGKDDDRVFIYRVSLPNSFLMGVADGISTARGRAAACWIETTMGAIAEERGVEQLDARGLFDRFRNRLAEAAQATQLADSLSTLSCGVGRFIGSGASTYLRFDFFGIGDSPIWRVVPCRDDTIVYQVSPVYSAPVPSALGTVYSWVNLGAGRIDGSVHFGSVDVNEGELLIVATDGLPESRMLFDDQDPERNGRSPRLIEQLLRSLEIDDNLLLELIRAYDVERLLIDDDASLAVARWSWPRELDSQVVGPSESAHQEEPATEHPTTVIEREAVAGIESEPAEAGDSPSGLESPVAAPEQVVSVQDSTPTPHTKGRSDANSCLEKADVRSDNSTNER